MTFSFSPSFSRALRKSSGRPPEIKTFNVLIRKEGGNQVRPPEGSRPGGLTQLVSGEGKTGGVLIQVLVEIDAQVAQLLLDSLDLLSQQSEGGSERLHSIPHGEFQNRPSGLSFINPH